MRCFCDILKNTTTKIDAIVNNNNNDNRHRHKICARVPQGLAYVEFENEAQASQAVLKMDRTKLENHVLSVAISNPPARKNEFMPVLGGAAPRQIQGT